MPGDSATERAFYFFACGVARLVYRVKAIGIENLPSGGCLLVPNHITWVDAIILQLACPRPVRFIIDEEFYHKPLLHPVVQMARAIPIDRRKPREAIRRATDQIEAGQFVCIFPEGQLSRTGTLARLQRGFEMIARHAQAPVVPVFLDQLWGSIFSFRGGRFFRKWPRHFPYRATVRFGVTLSAEEATIPRVQEDLLRLGADCFEQRPELRQHIARRAVRGLKRSPFAILVTDGMDGSKLSRGKLLGVSIALSRYLRKTFPEKRIAIVLPASKGAVVANLAVALDDKVPVGLNFTASSEASASAICLAPLFPQSRPQHHALVSAHRRHPDNHLSKSARSGEERCSGREVQNHGLAGDADFLARVFAQVRAATVTFGAAGHRWRRKDAARSIREIFRTIRQTRNGRLWFDRNSASCLREPARSNSGAARCHGATALPPRLGRKNGFRYCRGDPKSDD